MPKRKKSTNQSESLFNTGAYSKQTIGDFNDTKYDSGWDTGTAFPVVRKVTTDSKNTDVHNVSPRKNFNSSEVVNNTNNIEHLSPRNHKNTSDKLHSRYFVEEPPRSIDSNGQLSIFFEHSYEAPEPDDYKSITEYEAAWKQWQQDELRCQNSKTNVLNESKNLDQESHVLESKQFIRESVNDDTLINSTQNESSVLINSDSKYLGETLQNNASVNTIQNELFVLANSDSKYLGETLQSNASVNSTSNESLVLVNSNSKYLGETLQNDASVGLLQSKAGVLVDGKTFLGDEEYKPESVPVSDLDVQSDTERFLNETYKAGRQRRGSLNKTIENKTLKNGVKASYPRVIGTRDPDNVKHWRWSYCWEEKVDGQWRNRSLYVSPGAVSLIIGMQNNYCSVDEIISFIKKSKVKGEKKDKVKAKSDKQSKDSLKNDKKGKGKSKKSNS